MATRLMSLGLAGRIARTFLLTELTPLLALVGLLLGLFAVLVTPREEEPQINVTFANVFVPFPGATAREVEQLLSTPAEQVLAGIAGVEHVYSVSRPGLAVLTVQFKVGEPRTEALVRLYNQIYSNQDWLPASLGAGPPLIKPKGIDDVPILALTLWTADPQRSADELAHVAHALETDLKRLPGTRDLYTLGAPARVVQVRLDPARLAGYGLVLDDLRQALRAANAASDAGALVADNREIAVQAGSFLVSAEEVQELVVGLHHGAPVTLGDVAEVRLGPAQPQSYVWLGWGPAANRAVAAAGEQPAVTLAITKQPGANAVVISEQVLQRVRQLEGTLIPDGVQVTVSRDYGVTADDKARTLIHKLIFATAGVIGLVLIALGWREAVIVGAAVIITLTITLFASWAWGFTLNRVSLFALIFSIGILVDDAIVVVENIHRHLQTGCQSLIEAIPAAVDEVGGPTILATFTVIAALLPMAFVSGLMGPYMSPIPINASLGMLISLAVAFVFTPWLSYRLRHGGKPAHAALPTATPPAATSNHRLAADDHLTRLFRRLLGPFLGGPRGRAARWWLGGGLLLLIAGSLGLAYWQWVVLKMLPFDNKSEFQVVVDLPAGTSLEQTARVLGELGRELATVPEVSDYQVYAGTAAPINFNGLVRQYYLRSGANVGDIQVNLVDKRQRQRQSHAIVRALREPLQTIGRRHNANVKLVEVPPGPPVLAPLVAEIYGLDYAGQQRVAQQVRALFSATPDVVDVDDTLESPAERLTLHVDRTKAALLGVSAASVTADISAALRGEEAGYLHSEAVKYALPIRLELAAADQAEIETVLNLKVRGNNGQLVPLMEIVEVQTTTREQPIYHKDLLPVVFVVGDLAGPLDSPLYGMAALYSRLLQEPVAGQPLAQFFIRQPANPYAYSLKWDGEWQITYETFRDMGLAYAVGLVLIYLLVVAQFRSYWIPLIIMAPIPLTLIGILPGHALLGAQFTATSMIGMIALAGIIVRNSILLVDFINLEVANGVPFQEAVIRSGAVRAKPIVLTALAAMLGALFILDDPIFNGLAIALIFGILVATLLTLVVIPVLYYAARRRQWEVPSDIKVD